MTPFTGVEIGRHELDHVGRSSSANGLVETIKTFSSSPSSSTSPSSNDTMKASIRGETEVKCTTRWIECLLTATFDLELGQKIHQVYPSDYSLSQQQLLDIGSV